eukprot:TRINITY_DN58088_c0_g1_i1.p1 TRINITY_DN58088_c0_g1~~TRINITY_DN58088_c0_g1_i1.p1  ORF type:complete len:213 (-),score=47.55 TRINITY_DN58088_c0_g1_i1:448-1086(-)
MAGLSWTNKLRLGWAACRIGLARVHTMIMGAPPKKNRYCAKLLVLGLEAAGKTHMLQACKGDTREVMPTQGTNIQDMILVGEKFELQMNLWEIGGSEKIRAHWWRYTEGVHGLVWVVDPSADWEASLAALKTFMETGGRAVSSLPVLLLLNPRDLGVPCDLERFSTDLAELLPPGRQQLVISPGRLNIELFQWFASVLVPEAAAPGEEDATA